jgi:hypothetical protein
MSDLQTGYTWSDDKANWETNEATAIRLNRMMEDTQMNILAGANVTVTRSTSGVTIASTASGTGTVTSVGGTGTVNGITLSGTVTSSGNLTLGGTLSGVNLTSQVTGVLPQANGGTGQTTLGAGTYTATGGSTAISLASRSAQVINVLDYGVSNNATSDERSLIIAALEAARPSATTGTYVKEIVVVYGGSGYTSAPTVSVSVGSSGTFTAVVKDGMVQSVTVTGGGSGYAYNTEVTFTGGGGSGASAYALVGRGATVIFPPGRYQADAGIAIDGLHNVNIIANGAYLYRATTNGNPGLWVQGHCHNVNIEGLYLWGDATDRNGGYGVGILLAGDNIQLNKCSVSKWPNFAIQLSADTTTEARYYAGCTVNGCDINNTFADGIHLNHGYIGTKITNNIIRNTEEEDSIACFNDLKDARVSMNTLIANNTILDSRWRGILVAGCYDTNVIGNIINGTASHGILIGDDGTSVSLTLTLVNSSVSATVTAGTPWVGAYIWGTGLSFPVIITAVNGATITMNQAANATGSYSFSMYHGVLRVNVVGNHINNIATLTKNGTGYTDRHGIYANHAHRINIGNNLCVNLPSSGYAVKTSDVAYVNVSSNYGYDMASGTLTYNAGSNSYSVSSIYYDAGALKYLGTSGTVTTLGAA